MFPRLKNSHGSHDTKNEVQERKYIFSGSPARAAGRKCRYRSMKWCADPTSREKAISHKQSDTDVIGGGMTSGLMFDWNANLGSVGIKPENFPLACEISSSLVINQGILHQLAIIESAHRPIEIKAAGIADLSVSHRKDQCIIRGIRCPAITQEIVGTAPDDHRPLHNLRFLK